MKQKEVIELKEQHPDLYQKACYMERNAKLDKIKGLGGSWAWGGTDLEIQPVLSEEFLIGCECGL